MKRYSYSRELIAFVEARWLKTKCAVVGILIGAIIFFGIVTQNQSVGRLFEPRLVKTLTLENDILRWHLRLASPRVSNLEMQVKQLNEQADKLRVLLPNHEVVWDSVPHPMVESEGFKSQFVVSRAVTF